MAEDSLIGRMLLLQETEKLGTEVTEAEVTKAFENLVAQHGGATEHLLLEAGLTVEQEGEFLEDLRCNLRVETLLAGACGDDLVPTDDQITEFYLANPDLFLSAREVKASHIFREPQPVERSREIYNEIVAVRKRALAGEDFSLLAAECSDKKEESADLGWFTQGDVMDEFEAMAFSMDEGEITPVFQNYSGFHLAKITGVRGGTVRPLDEMRDDIREILVRESRHEKANAFVRTLREKATINREDNA
jgi:parvulin-like peptidyl-prolyl isomerase